jgi:hypothetical protein
MPKSVLLIVLAFVLVIILICMVTGLIMFSLSPSSSCCGKRRNPGFAFAAGAASGSVSLSWTNDFSGWPSPVTIDTANSVDFILQIWTGSDTTGAPTQKPTLNSDGSNGGLRYNTPTTSDNITYNYGITLDAATYFTVGSNTMTLESSVGSLTSAQSATATVSVGAAITAAATFNGTNFVACGYTDTLSPPVISATKTMLLWKQPVTAGNNPSDFCYTLTTTGAGSMAALGFVAGTTNGVTTVVANKTMTVTFDSSAKITTMATCCCIPSSVTTTSILQSSDKKTNYVLLISDNVATATGQNIVYPVTLTTYQSDCKTIVGDPSVANVTTIGPVSAPTLTTSCLVTPSCVYSASLVSNAWDKATSSTVCGTTLTGAPLSGVTEGNAVKFTLAPVPSWSNLTSVLTVNETALNSPSKTNSIVSTDILNWTGGITWNLPSGAYTASCVLYTTAFDNGPLVAAYNVVAAPFNIDLETPQSLAATGVS